MKKYYQWSAISIVSFLLLILMSACGFSSFTATQQAAPTPTPKPKTPLEILQEANTKMNALHSVAVDGTYISKESNSDSGDTNTQMKMSGQMVKSPSSASIQMDGTITTHGTSVPLALAMILVDQKTYMQNTKKPDVWYILNNDQSQALGGLNSLNSDTGDVITVTKASDVTDHGMDILNGKKLRHLTIMVTNDRKDLKKAFLEATGDFKNLTPAQVDAIKLESGTVDYWIDEGTMYAYQTVEHYTAQYYVDASGAIATSGSSVTKDQSTTMAFSKFNAQVSIKAPANAQQLQNILQLFM